MKTLIPLIFSLIFSTFLSAQPSPVLVPYENGFNDPVALANANDGTNRLFVGEKSGYIKIIDTNGNTLPNDFLDIDAQVQTVNERGFLGMAFHPNYATNGFFYVNYTNNNGNTRIDRFQVSATDPNMADLSSQVNLLTINQPFANHNAGDLAFGPDGYLYIPMGDGGGPANCDAQSGQSFLGKILRFDVDQNMNSAPYYGIPASNPYVDNSNFLDEIWAIGLRNPWRFSFDRETGDMWLADVGQSSWEEVNFQPANSSGGENYGWTIMEGNTCYNDPNCTMTVPPCNSNDYTDPIFVYDHSAANGGFSIAGGYVYRGCQYPELEGYYVCADTYSGNMWTVESNGDFDLHPNSNAGNIVSFGEDENGEMFVASLNGTIYQVTSGTAVSCTSCPFPVTVLNDSPVCAGETIAIETIPTDAANYHFFLDANANGIIDNGESLQNGSLSFLLSNNFMNGDIIGVEVTDNMNCVVTEFTMITVLPDAIVTLTADDPVCENESINFVAAPSNGNNYFFFLDDNMNGQFDNGEALQDGNSNTYTSAGLNDGDVVGVIMTDGNGCLSQPSFYTVIVVNDLTVQIASNAPQCEGDNIFFIANPSNGVLYTFFWDANFNGMIDPGETLQSSAQNNYISTTITDQAVVGVEVISGDGCSGVATTQVTVFQEPTAFLNSDQPQCEGEEITFIAFPQGAALYTFFLDINVNGLIDNGEIVQASNASFFISNTLNTNDWIGVEVTTMDGCTDITTQEVIFLPPNDPTCQPDCPNDYADGGNGALTGVIISTENYETDGVIDSYQTLSGNADVIYDSAVEIELNVNFECEVGAELEIIIDGCEDN